MGRKPHLAQDLVALPNGNMIALTARAGGDLANKICTKSTRTYCETTGPDLTPILCGGQLEVLPDQHSSQEPQTRDGEKSSNARTSFCSELRRQGLFVLLLSEKGRD